MQEKLECQKKGLSLSLLELGLFVTLLNFVPNINLVVLMDGRYRSNLAAPSLSFIN